MGETRRSYEPVRHRVEDGIIQAIDKPQYRPRRIILQPYGSEVLLRVPMIDLILYRAKLLNKPIKSFRRA